MHLNYSRHEIGRQGPESITVRRGEISRRYPDLLFYVTVPRGRLFEVACATDPRLFHPDSVHQRSARNFYSSVHDGLIRGRGQRVAWAAPTGMLESFAGARRLYYALATYGAPDGRAPRFSVLPTTLDRCPSIAISDDWVGNRRGGAATGGGAPTSRRRYGSGARAPLRWGGDGSWRRALDDMAGGLGYTGGPSVADVLAGRGKVKRDHKGPSVRAVQAAMVEFGLMLPRKGIDGFFGPETEQSVKDFQRLKGIPETGEVDRRTMTDLSPPSSVTVHGGSCVGKIEVGCPDYISEQDDGSVAGTCIEPHPHKPGESGFRPLDTLWYKTTIPGSPPSGKFRVHHVARNAAGEIFHTFRPHSPDPNWHNI